MVVQGGRDGGTIRNANKSAYFCGLDREARLFSGQKLTSPSPEYVIHVEIVDQQIISSL